MPTITFPTLHNRGGGDIETQKRQIQAAGFKVEDGKVSIKEKEPDIHSKSLISKLMNNVSGEVVQGLLANLGSACSAAYYATQQANFTAESSEFSSEHLQKIRNKAMQTGDYSKVLEESLNTYDTWQAKYIKKNDGLLTQTALGKQFTAMRNNVAQQSLEFMEHGAREHAVLNTRAMTSIIADQVRNDPSMIETAVESIEGHLGTFIVTAQSELRGTMAMEAMRSETILGAIQQAGKMDLRGGQALYDKMLSKMTAEDKKKADNLLIQLGRGHLKAYNSKVRQELAVERVQGILSGAVKIITADRKDLKQDVDLVFKDWENVASKPAFSNLSKEDVVIATGYMPPSYAGQLKMSLNVGGVEHKMAAAPSILKIANEAPPGTEGIDKELTAHAQIFQLLFASERDGTKAAEKFDALMQVPREHKAEMDKHLNNFLKDGKSKGTDVISQLTSEVFTHKFKEWLPDIEYFRSSIGSFDAPASNINFQKEAKATLEYYFNVKGMNNIIAKELTLQDLKRNWGSSEALGAKPYPAFRPIENEGVLQGVGRKTVIANFEAIAAQLNTDAKTDTKNYRLYYTGTNTKEGHPKYRVYLWDDQMEMVAPLIHTVEGKKETLEITPNMLGKLPEKQNKKSALKGILGQMPE